MTKREVVRALTAAGFRLVRSGRHHIYEKLGVRMPVHLGDKIPPWYQYDLKAKLQEAADKEAMLTCPGGRRSSDHTPACFAAQDRALDRVLSVLPDRTTYKKERTTRTDKSVVCDCGGKKSEEARLCSPCRKAERRGKPQPAKQAIESQIRVVRQ